MLFLWSCLVVHVFWLVNRNYHLRLLQQKIRVDKKEEP